MTTDDLRAILAKRTPGRWFVDNRPGTWNPPGIGSDSGDFPVITGPDGEIDGEDTAAAIVVAINSIGPALDVVEAAREAWTSLDDSYPETESHLSPVAALRALRAVLDAFDAAIS